MPRPFTRQLIALMLSSAAYAGVAYATPRANFGQLLGLIAVAFAAYFWLVRSQLPLRAALVAGLLFRLLWLPATPALSDDYHRFRWDGLLVAGGKILICTAPPTCWRPCSHRQRAVAATTHRSVS
ncbi:hypothetical protein H9L05_19230 [Hymenobacter qilianensis]|uniref:Uncharacterized protein n=1 Tax=Hymenobacter qilianensis TaxID=1385715 RepID=A0A7H0GUP4_9BACT|nr:hypothetical protein [Hymenobacter qilianensis]QNP52010.1 hypothetical protein H9L05_19230 [Hymenobacter qilianensis]